jgi:hypothetical protein
LHRQLLAAIGPRPADAPPDPDPEDWYANTMRLHGRTCLLLTHAATLFTVFRSSVVERPASGPMPARMQTMDSTQFVNIGTLAIALVSIIASWLLARQALKLNQNSNHLPVVLDLLATQRTAEFLRKEKRLWDHLNEYDEDLGFFELPEPIRSDAIEIALYYQSLGYVSEYGLADGELITIQAHYRMLRTWDTIKPFVQGERRLRGGENTFLNSYELFAGHARPNEY